ncbi:GAF domain-containing protein [Actinoplanes xinjiangensis]|uniref:GAF domain-containing protein n=1 Tax=Actinoplanes xinjiangensis TaxID=512350 RepID=A0A316F7R9_9ACTN|nr:GAF domain-containing protein [Actinoplanes xinjiangensis]PWK42745.1 GAF domain-containing protein [Actinoplanes xinjiangensis]GIF38307.1 hypothetical protein Axi01nite_26180 [Actinoplanes xinjiangensis]
MPRRINDDERLRRLEAVTDATLSRLDASDLLDELLDRVRDLLGVDTAAILLLDAHSQHLVATAAKGLEEEVRAGFRVAVGRGFAGRVAAVRAAVRLTDVTPADVVNPLLVAKGIRSLLGVPIVAGRDLVGVLHVGTLRRREFADDDVKLLELVADRAAVAGRIRSANSTSPPRWPCSAACCRPGCRRSRGSTWPRVTFRGTPPASAATGMTCSSCRPAGWAW